MIKITEVRMVWFGGDSIFKTYIYVFFELGPVKKNPYIYVRCRERVKLFVCPHVAFLGNHIDHKDIKRLHELI